MQIYKGTIITCDTNHHVYQYLVEHQGKIEYVGNDIPNKYQHQPIIDLKNQALIPSFCDSHMHFASYATFHAGLNVMQAKSNEEILEMIQTFSKNCKDPMIIAFGASHYSVKDQTLVTRQQ